DGWPAEVPEKKINKPKVVFNNYGTNKLLIDLVSGGAVATIAKTAFGGNMASVARYAQSLGLNFAFKENYKNFFLEGCRNERKLP
ncbi:hypothetical protein PMAYCL1PPCAC_20606, partial [Pristionchus mayeri]